MTYKALYRKYRPDCFDSIVGQDLIIQTLKNSILNNKVSHAYIFSGPRGTGKTSTAKVFAKALNCLNLTDGNPCGSCDSCLNFNKNPDIIELDAASNNGVDDVRELINNVKLAPSISKYKIYIIDEVHMLTNQAFNALLLTLEEPPSNVVFIFATTNIECVPITILSRCQRFDFSQISMDSLKNKLSEVCMKEDIIIEDAAINEIAMLCEGGLRDALGILDKLSSQSSNITLDYIQKTYNIVSSKVLNSLIDSFFNNNPNKVINILNNIKNNSYDYKYLAKNIIIFLRNYIIDHNINFDFNLKNMIFDINKSIVDINIYVDPIIVLESIFLSYINNNLQIANDDNAIINNDDKIYKTESKNNDICDVNVQNYFPGNNFEHIKTLRINNCFVNPQKNLLLDFQKSYQLFLNSCDDNNILSLLVDAKPCVCSENYIIFESNSKVNVDLANNSLNVIDELLSNFFKKKIYSLFLTSTDWNIEKKKYISNIKSNNVYIMMNDDIINDEGDELANLANDIFLNDKIEME